MKRMGIILGIILTICMLSACGKKEEEQAAHAEPKVTQMQSICELAAYDCYFHNVAKFDQKNTSGFWLWSKDKRFWVEYSGIVTIGVDVSKMKIVVDGENVRITIPEAKVLNSKVDAATLTEDSFVVENGTDKPTAEDQTMAFQAAQEDMLENASSDAALLANAQKRAQTLLEEYVKNISDVTGVPYHITWEFIEDDTAEEGE